MGAALNNLWLHLLGSKDDFNFKTRILNLVNLCSVLVTLGVTLTFTFAGLFQLALASLALSLFYLLCLYLSRFLNLFKLSKALYALGGFSIIAISYFFTGGSQGPALYSFLVIFLTLVVTGNPKKWQIWFLLHLVAITTLITIELQRPESVGYFGDLEDPAFQSLNVLLAYFSIFTVLFTAAIYIQNNYNRIHGLLSDQVKSLEDKDKFIKEKMAELEDTNKQKDRLFSIIGHDLRNPLASIEGYLLTLDYDIDNETRDEIKDQLISLCQNSSNLLDNLLEWAKKDTKVHPEILNAKEVALAAIETLKPIAHDKKIEIKVLMDEDDAMVIADRNMLEMVIRNLTNNAIKFTPENGVIKIRAYTRSDYIVLEVEDNGVGMTEDQQKRIFTPERLVTAGTSSEKGVGLGLILCKEFTEKMNGSITCSSQEGKGSSFKFKLPIPDNIENQPELQRPAQAN